MNRVILAGNICSDIEFKTFDGGKSKANFSIAINEFYTNAQGEKVKQASFIRCIAWGKTAESINKNLSKGRGVMVEASLKTRKYDSNDGTPKTIMEVVVNNWEFPPSSGNGNGEGRGDGGNYSDSKPKSKPKPRHEDDDYDVDVTVDDDDPFGKPKPAAKSAAKPKPKDDDDTLDLD